MGFSPRNFTKSNTPSWAQKVGDVMLTLGVIGTCIITLPATVPGIVLPSIVLSAGGWLMGVGTIGKALSKFWGVNTDDPSQPNP